MHIILLTLSSILASLILSHTTSATPVLIWSNREQPSLDSTQYFGRDVTFSTFDVKILRNIEKENPDLILAFVTPSVTLADLTKYGDVYSASNGHGDGCLSNTKAAILNSASSLSIDEVLPGSSSMLNHLRTSFANFKGYCFAEISTRGQLEEKLKLCDKLVVVIVEAHTGKPHLEQSLRNTDSTIATFMQLANERNLHYTSLLLGNTLPSQMNFRSKREISQVGSSSTDSNSTIKFIIRTNNGAILFRAQRLAISLNGSAGSNSTYQLTQNNTVFVNSSNNNHTRYFELRTSAMGNENISIKFVFPLGTANSSTSTFLNTTIPKGYWSMYIDVTIGSAPAVSLSPPRSRIAVPKEFSFHCTPVTNFTNKNSKQSKMVVMISSMQVQPFGVVNTSANTFQFSSADDCVGFFTIDIWMGIFASLVIFSLLYCAVMATMAISTSDRVDDPQGKPLMMEGTTQ